MSSSGRLSAEIMIETIKKSIEYYQGNMKKTLNYFRNARELGGCIRFRVRNCNKRIM